MVGRQLLHDLGVADKPPHLPDAIGHRAEPQHVLGFLQFQKIPGILRAGLTAPDFFHVKMFLQYISQFLAKNRGEI